MQQPVCCMAKPRLLQPRDRIAASAVAASRSNCSLGCCSLGRAGCVVLLGRRCTWQNTMSPTATSDASFCISCSPSPAVAAWIGWIVQASSDWTKGHHLRARAMRLGCVQSFRRRPSSSSAYTRHKGARYHDVRCQISLMASTARWYFSLSRSWRS